MKNVQQEEIVSREEKAAREVEDRRVTAEGNYVILLQDSKNVRDKIAEGETILASHESVKQEKLDAIEKAKIELSNIQGKIQEENARFADVVAGHAKSREDHTAFKESASKEKESIISDIGSLKSTHLFVKAEQEQEILALEQKKAPMVEEIKSLSEKIEVLKGQEIKHISKVEQAEQKHKNALIDIRNAETAIEGLKKDSCGIDSLMSEKSSEFEGLKTQVEIQKSESEKISAAIEAKKEEFKKLEIKAFSLLSREDTLNQKEEFLKSQYERAGIPWES